MWFRIIKKTFILGALFLCLTSCYGIDGSDPYALWDEFVNEQSNYRFKYLSPPWKIAGTQVSQNPVLYIGKEPLAFPYSRETKMRLEVIPFIASSMEDATMNREAVWVERQCQLIDEIAYTNNAGDVGMSFIWENADFQVREVFFLGTDETVVVMSIWATTDMVLYLTDDDVELILESFEPRSI